MCDLNEFGQFVLDNKDKKWQWYFLSKNPNISLKFIIDHPELPWNWAGVSKNTNLNVNTIITHPNLKWNFQQLQFNNNLTFKDIKKLQKYFDFEIDYNSLSSNKKITENDLYNENLNENFSYCSLMIENKNISLNFYIEKYEMGLIDNEFFKFLSFSNCLTANYVNENINEDWDWFQVSRNKNISLNDIEEYLNIFDWDKEDLSYNPNITINFVKNHLLDIDWDWFGLSINKGIKIQDIFNNLDLPWNWNGIKNNPNLTLKDIQQHPNKLWFASSNKNLTIEYIKNNPELKWDYNFLSLNQFNYKKKNKSAKIIQNCYKKYKLRQLYFGWIELIEMKRMDPNNNYFKKLIENIFIHN